MMTASSAWLLLLLSAATAAAQEPPKKEALEAVIESIKGTVDVKRPEDKDWVPAEKDMKLKQGSSICTSVASSASLLLTGNIKVTVKSLTEAKVEDLVKGDGKVNADVNLKFGSIEVDIQKGDLRTDLKVRSPNSTTSVSGSTGIVRSFASDKGSALLSLKTFSGTWTFTPNSLGMEIPIEGAGGADDQGTLPQDLNYQFKTDQFLNYFGKSESELYQGTGAKAGDPYPGIVPIYEFATTGPAAQAHQQPATLPLPPGPPGP